MSALPLALTMGEPAGIAPEITVAAWLALAATGPVFVLIGDAPLLRERARALGLDIAVTEIGDVAAVAATFRTSLPVLPCPLASPAPAPGHPDPGQAGAVIRSITRAVDLVLAGEVAAIVTNPIQKETLYAAGFRHEGHTDFLADLAVKAGHPAEPVMMLSVGSLRSVPVTVHIPLKEVPGRLSQAAIERQARVLARGACPALRHRRAAACRRRAQPACRRGRHDRARGVDIIGPAVAALRAEGIDVTRPAARRHAVPRRHPRPLRRGRSACITTRR